MLSIKKLKLPQAFTLIELLVVLVIITILAGLLVTVGRKARNEAKKAEAKCMMHSIEVALAMYHVDMGVYPLNDLDGWGCWEMYDQLTNTNYGDDAHADYDPNWKGPYMEFDEDLISSGDGILDPWGGIYNYNSEVNVNNEESFDLWSFGPNKINEWGDSTPPADDIKNW